MEVARREVEAGADKLGDPDFEGNAGPSGRLLEDHPERPAREEVMLFASFLLLLELVSELEDSLELVARPVGDPREVASFQILERRNHAGSMLLEHLALVGVSGTVPARGMSLKPFEARPARPARGRPRRGSRAAVPGP